MNPYWGCDCLSFFITFVSRLFSFQILHPVSDEIQMLTLASLAVCCGCVGPFLVLRKMTMFANSLSHTMLLGIAASFVCLGSTLEFSMMHLLVGATLAAVLTCIMTEGLIQWFSLPEESSVALVFSFLFALGIVFVTVFLKNVHLGVESVTGNVDALQIADLKHAFYLAVLNLLFVVLFYRRLLLTSFDVGLAKVLGVSTSAIHFSLLLMVSITCVGAFRAVGVLLVLAFLVGPYLTARLFVHRLQSLICLSIALGIFASFLGVSVARHVLSQYDLALSTGGLVVCFLGLFYFLAIFLKAWRQAYFDSKNYRKV